MRYAYKDLGHQEAGASVTARLRGSAPNLLLLDSENFARYRMGLPFSYIGGHYARSPVQLEIPEDGHWYAIIDLGGYKGRARASFEVEPAGSRST